MQRGKWVVRASMAGAVMGPPGRAVSASVRVASGVRKDLERCARIGLSRSSSSRRGRARLVSWVRGDGVSRLQLLQIGRV